jgi:hypothetical protein
VKLPANGKVKIAIIEAKLDEAFTHLGVLNGEMGDVKKIMGDCQVKICTLEKGQVDMQEQIDRRFNANDFLTKLVLGTVIFGVVSILLDIWLRGRMG